MFGGAVVDVTGRGGRRGALTAARHGCDLRPDGRIHLHVDAAHHGLGSASCGPPVPAWHTLAAVPASFTVGLAGEGPGAGTTVRSAEINQELRRVVAVRRPAGPGCRAAGRRT